MAIQAASNERQLVVFSLNNESYGIDIESVREIIRMQDVTHVPRAPKHVRGVINIRGKVIPILCLRERFGLSVLERTDDQRIVVLEIGDVAAGIVVDKVDEVMRIPEDSINPPSAIVTTADSNYLEGIANLDDRLIILLDLQQVVTVASEATRHETLDAESNEEAALQTADAEEEKEAALALA